ncbi:hypothetical protein ABZV93_12060 [Actinopolymorpha sp. NPDC004070]|uniref:hypothetical protein n=1 Tax=Actinopolymorpha sp. NPDC004070 TaxID=3154548 RepID=UPI00339F0B66
MNTGDNSAATDGGRELSYAQRVKARLIQRGYRRDIHGSNAYTLGAVHFILTSAKAAPTPELMAAEVDKALEVLAALEEFANDTDPTHTTTKRGDGRP